MDTRRRRPGAALATGTAGLVLAALVGLPLLGCRRLSEEVRDPSVGPNGGFEAVRDGLPVNWLVYTPDTVPDARFRVALDADERKDGARSLRFDVEACTGEPGWRSPGIVQEVPAEPGTTYDVSFWIRSEGAEHEVRVGSVSAKEGSADTRTSAARDGTWHRVRLRHTVAEPYERIRFELGVLSPGTLWIDGVRIEPAAAGGEAGG